MIALRRRIERGLANPWLRPLFVVLLALLLAFVVLHTAHDGNGAAPGMGICLGIVLALSAILIDPTRVLATPRLIHTRPDRGPPRLRLRLLETPVPPPLLIRLRR